MNRAGLGRRIEFEARLFGNGQVAAEGLDCLEPERGAC